MQKTIKSDKSQLTIDTQGGKIVELVIAGAKILGSFQRIDGKIGATHICTPNFAGEGMTEFGLPFHGPARNLEWQVVSESENMIEIKVTLEALEKYKSALEVRQIFRLIDSLTKVRIQDGKEDVGTRDLSTRSLNTHGVEMTQNQSHSEASVHEPWNLESGIFHHEVHVKNIGSVAVPVNIGIHNYFHTSNGWSGTKLNEHIIDEQIMKNLSVKIADIVDSAEEISTLEVRGEKTIVIKTEGAADFVTWTGVKEGKYDDKYACIEPVCWFDTKFFGTPPSLLKPQERRILKQTLSLR